MSYPQPAKGPVENYLSGRKKGGILSDIPSKLL